MEWKDWTTLPDVDSQVVKALRTLAFEEQAKDKDPEAYDIRYQLGIIQTIRTLAAARVILFFVQRDNAWVSWNGLKSYLQEKYGYAESTINGNIAISLRKLCEFFDERLRLRPEVYAKAVEILEDEELLKEYAGRFEYVVEEWLEKHGYYDDDDEDEDEEEIDEPEEEPLAELVLKRGERVRVVLELELVVKNVRFEVS